MFTCRVAHVVSCTRTFRFHRSPFKTHYTVLKVHSDYSDEEIKQAYDAAVERVKTNAANEISALNLAYNAVKEHSRRKEYNLMLAERHEGYFRQYLNTNDSKEKHELREFIKKACSTDSDFEFDLTIHREECVSYDNIW
uniref:J domain-containing protein n=1 Tax=Steinernema glaseri TaxID=37863 RepID=A0A1I8A0Y5_9BILA